MRRTLALGLFVAGLLTISPAAASAATFTVNNTADAGPGSLRDAIVNANAPGNDIIDFSLPPGSTIQLTSGALAIDPSNTGDLLTINGPGANTLTVRGAPGNPILNIIEGTNTISGITFAGATTGPFAGAVNNDVNTTLTGVAISGNSSDAGGNGSAGGLTNFGNLTLRNSTISGNSVTNSGAAQSGGGIVNVGQLTLVNTTVSNNTVQGPGPDDGGGIVTVAGTATLLNSTIANNTVQNGAGGVMESGGPVSLANTLLAVNSGSAGNDIVGLGFNSQGYNLIGTTTGGTITAATGDQFGSNASMIDPMLGALGDNGGTTQTRSLLVGSPALNMGNPGPVSDAFPLGGGSLVPCATTDQTGEARPQNGVCDIGAFESPGNEFSFGALKRNTKKGTAKLEVVVPGDGELALSGKGVKKQRPFARAGQALAKPVAGPGTVKLKIQSKGKKKKKLKRKGKVKVKITATFTPTHGLPNAEKRKVKLKLDRGKERPVAAPVAAPATTKRSSWSR